MNDVSTKLRLALYEAPDGPRVMLFGSLQGEFRKLQECFRNLASNQRPLEIHSLSFIQPFGDIRLIASCSGSMLEPLAEKAQGLRKVDDVNGHEFNWLRTAEGWEYLADLIDGLVTSSNPGHQYLSNYPTEDAILVVSKGEYGDDVLSK